MTNAEKLGITMLREFVNKASDKGICYNGEDMFQPVQVAVIKIVEQYIEEYEEQ